MQKCPDTRKAAVKEHNLSLSMTRVGRLGQGGTKLVSKPKGELYTSCQCIHYFGRVLLRQAGGLAGHFVNVRVLVSILAI